MMHDETPASRLPIQYRDFYDVPRVFLVEFKQRRLLFESRFDDAADEYSDDYNVYLLSEVNPSDLSGSWEHLATRGRPIGRVPVSRIAFDVSRRRDIDARVVAELVQRAGL